MKPHEPSSPYFLLSLSALPLLYAIIFSVSTALGFVLPASMAQIFTLASVLILLWCDPTKRLRISRIAAIVSGIFVLSVIYQASINTFAGKIGGGIGNQISLLMGAAVALLVYATPYSTNHLLKATFAASGLVVGGSFVASLANGGLDLRGEARPEFGFGNISYLTNTCGMAVIAWACAQAMKSRTETSSPAWERPACLLACIALGILCLGTGRRASLIMALGASLITASSMWRLSPKKLLISILMIAAVVVAVLLFCYAVGYRPRIERLLMYQAFFELFPSIPWYGAGDGAATLTLSTTTEACRHLSSTELWFWHSHNELLECLLTGGWPLLVIFITLWTSISIGAFRIKDRDQRVVCLVLLFGLFVVAVTNNTLSTFMGRWWAGLVAGIVLKAYAAVEDPSGRLETLTIRPELKTILLLATSLCLAVGIGRSLPTALAKPNDGSRKLFAGYILALDPETAGVLGCLAASEAAKEGKWGDSLNYALHVRNRLGPIGDIDSTLSVALARANDMQRRLSLETEIVSMFPFRARGYRLIQELTHVNPDWRHGIPDSILRRVDRTPLPDSSTHSGNIGIDEAANIFISALDDRERGRPPALIQEKLEGIAVKYGDVPQVASSVFRLSISTDLQHPWSDPVIKSCGRGFGAFNISDLEDVDSEAKARRAAPLLKAWFPQIDGAVEQRKALTVNGAMDDRTVFSHVYRILALAGSVRSSSPLSQ